MKVFKFGGASVKEASAVRNVAEILKLFPGEKRTVVISAMGKTTNGLENLLNHLWEENQSDFEEKLSEVRTFHSLIMMELFTNSSASIFEEIETVFEEITNKYPKEKAVNYDYLYDQIVSYGEILSSKIVSAFLSQEGHNSRWADARQLVQTNHRYREGEIDWPSTEKKIANSFLPHFEKFDIQVTQGFIGHTSDNKTTTLGREGSDYTAGIFAYCTNAESVTIWKDVPGMLNADPKYFDDTVKLDKISFKEAIELSYYGASVIHPKTIKPLQNKKIPLYVKSFIHPKKEGTIIQSEEMQDHLVPSFIFKMNQILISFSARDFSFIVEEHLSDIFNRLARANAKINLMQNSALNFSVLLDRDKIDLPHILGLFENNYKVRFNDELELVTIRHFDDATRARVCKGKEIILEQKTRETARLVLKNR
jgi:aspartate kinase